MVTMTDEKFTHEDKIKHLEFIQDAIARMNSNSFQMRAWMLLLVTALLGSFANTGKREFVLLALFPTIVFWILDTYFLQLERKFRGVYEDVAGISDNPKAIKPFAMPINLYEGGKYAFWDVFFSKSMFPFYALVIVVLTVVYVIG
jgi:hypothetical protein